MPRRIALALCLVFAAPLVAGLLDNGRGIAVPIVFEVSQMNIGCALQTACQPSWSWDLAELIDPCVNNPVFPP